MGQGAVLATSTYTSGSQTWLHCGPLGSFRSYLTLGTSECPCDSSAWPGPSTVLTTASSSFLFSSQQSSEQVVLPVFQGVSEDLRGAVTCVQGHSWDWNPALGVPLPCLFVSGVAQLTPAAHQPLRVDQSLPSSSRRLAGQRGCWYRDLREELSVGTGASSPEGIRYRSPHK